MKKIALWISLIGHPAIIVPLTVTLLSWRGGISSLSKLLIPILILITVLMAFSVWQVRRHRWKDIDASQPLERKKLLLALGLCLLILVLLPSSLKLPSGLRLGFFITSLQVTVAISLSRWLKLSFHSAFNAFCSILLWPMGLAAVILGFIWTGIVAWSRLILNRHTVREVLWGGCLGCTGGLLFWLLNQGR